MKQKHTHCTSGVTTNTDLTFTFTIIGMSYSSTVTFITIKLVFFSICSIGENDFEKMPFLWDVAKGELKSSRVDGSQTLIL